MMDKRLDLFELTGNQKFFLRQIFTEIVSDGPVVIVNDKLWIPSTM
jgi:hypothetical protein